MVEIERKITMSETLGILISAILGVSFSCLLYFITKPIYEDNMIDLIIAEELLIRDKKVDRKSINEIKNEIRKRRRR